MTGRYPFRTNKSKRFAHGNVTVDLWPDISELAAASRAGGVSKMRTMQDW